MSLIAGHLEEVKISLGIILILSSFGVWFGVYLENEKFSKYTQKKGHKLLSIFLAVETAVTALLFSTDTYGSYKLSEKLMETSNKLTEADNELTKIKTPRLFSEKSELKIIQMLKPFSGTPFDLSINPSPEPTSLAHQLIEILTKSGWKFVNNSKVQMEGMQYTIDQKSTYINSTFTGLGIEIDVSKTNDWGQALLALGKSLEINGIDNVQKVIANDGSANSEALHLYIGIKPL